MKAKFKTKKDAVLYYNRHNHCMSSSNMNNNYKNDCDPKAKLIYIVRKNYNINCTVEPFSIDDDIYKDENGIISYHN